MSQVPPYSPYGQPYPYAPYPPPPAKKGLPVWLVPVVVGATVVCILGSVGAALAFPSLVGMFSGGAIGGPTLPASVGQSLNINGMTVTLMSAKSYTYTPFLSNQEEPGLELALHCWNQTDYSQSVNMDTWELFIDGGHTEYYTFGSLDFRDSSSCSLETNQTQDIQLDVNMNAGDHGPYILQSDFTTPQGQPLAWTFNA